VARASWTYEVPRAGSGSAGLEEYMVEDKSGEPVGKVVTLLEHGGEHYVLVERGRPPIQHDRRAVPWSDVEAVDHEALAVRIDLTGEELSQVLQLDPEKQVEGGPAEAVRALPPRPPATSADVPGPVDRAAPYAATFALGAIGLIVLLGLFLFASTTDFDWEYVLFVIPAALFVGALMTGYNLTRRPYEGTKTK
jgi:hypothetical protein